MGGDYYGSSSSAAAAPPAAAAAAAGHSSQSSHRSTGISLQHSDAAKIFVGGLSWQTTEESLRWHFEQYGTVVSVEVMRDRHTGDPRGFAFVVFAEAATLDLVMADKDKHEINHKFVDVKRAQARGVAPPSIHENHTSRGGHHAGSESGSSVADGGGAGGDGSTAVSSTSFSAGDQFLSPEQKHAKVFVGGIPHDVDSDALQRIFAQFGTVTDAIVMLDQTTQRSRGFGFVTFDTAAAAAASIAAQPVEVHGRGVEVKLATPRTTTTTTTTTDASSQPHHHGGGHHHHHHRALGTLPPAPKHLGLRAGQSSGGGKYAGLAVAYGRSGWKAGYGTKAFGAAGWNIWEDTVSPPPEKAGFSFDMLDHIIHTTTTTTKSDGQQRPAKRLKQEPLQQD